MVKTTRSTEGYIYSIVNTIKRRWFPEENHTKYHVKRIVVKKKLTIVKVTEETEGNKDFS